MIDDAVRTFHCNRVKMFIGSFNDAKQAALRDADQYFIDKFLAYKGNPEVRNTMSFYVRFADTCCHWKNWSKDLYDTEQYELYCKSKPELTPLITLQKESLILKQIVNNKPITCVEPGNNVYMDLRALGAGLYEFLQLPDCHFVTYVVCLEYISWQNSGKTRINCRVPLLDLRWSGKHAVNHAFAIWWGSLKQVSPNMTVIDDVFVDKYNIINVLKENN